MNFHPLTLELGRQRERSGTTSRNGSEPKNAVGGFQREEPEGQKSDSWGVAGVISSSCFYVMVLSRCCSFSAFGNFSLHRNDGKVDQHNDGAFWFEKLLNFRID
jgi:hypothetical protein